MWFKVDDKFPNHRKVRQVRRSHPTKRRDASAFGLWALAGAWSDDGFVPLEVLEDWDDDAEAMALRLVDAGLWVSCCHEDEPGFRFHDWDDMNPDPATAGAMGNHRRWHERRGKVDPKCIFCVPDRGDIAPESPPNRNADRVGIVSGIADPTRPDPTIEEEIPASDDAPTPTHYPAEFEQWWEHYPSKKGKGGALTAWKKAKRKVDPSELITATDSYAHSENVARGFAKNPSTWLNQECWLDETQPTQIRPSGYRIEEDWSA
jgi:hypothetical protein